MHRRLDRAVWQRQMAMRGTVVASMRVVEVAAVTDRRCRMWGATQLAMQEDLCRHRALQRVQWWREVEDRPKRQERQHEMRWWLVVGAQRVVVLLLGRLQELLW